MRLRKATDKDMKELALRLWNALKEYEDAMETPERVARMDEIAEYGANETPRFILA